MSHGTAENCGRPREPVSAFPDPARPRSPRPAAPVELATEIPLLLQGAAGLARQRGCRLEFAVQPQLSVPVELGVFRCAMSELLWQAIARAQSCVLVGARCQADRVKITVSDDGSGVSNAPHAAYAAMQPLAAQGATMQVESRPGRGTTLVVTLPAGSAVAANGPAPEYRN